MGHDRGSLNGDGSVLTTGPERTLTSRFLVLYSWEPYPTAAFRAEVVLDQRPSVLSLKYVCKSELH